MLKIEEIQDFIRKERESLLRHRLYPKIKEMDHLRRFTEIHAYAVWDFMSLLKALQIQLTCTSIPWFASERPNMRYLINEIVLAEESDEYLDGRRLSHFEMYLDAMHSMDANTIAIDTFIQDAKSSPDIFEVINRMPADQRIRDFLRFTFETINSGKAHKIAAAFTFGREDLIPDMFTSILQELQLQFPSTDISKLVYYFQRHIELDADEHGPLATRMIEELGGSDPDIWDEMRTTAKEALVHRTKLWDAIADSIAP